MVTMTVYANGDVVAWLINITNGSIKLADKDHCMKRVGLKKSRKYPFEIQIPIVAISRYFVKDGYAIINLDAIQKLNVAD